MGVVDRNANNRQRLIRQSQRLKGSLSTSGITSSLIVTAPLDTASGSLAIDLLAAGGITTNSLQLTIKLDPTNPGLALTTTGLKVILSDSSLALAVGGLSIAAGGVSLAKLGVLTTRGDLLGHDNTTNHVRVPVGSDTQVLTADSTQTAGVKWAAPAAYAPPLTTKGDIFAFSTTNARFPIGVSNGLVLTTDSTQTFGFKWATPLQRIFNEVPSGTVNGTNPTFTLAHSPASGTSSILLSVNGVIQTPTTQYTISGATITFQVGAIPIVSDSILATYEY